MDTTSKPPLDAETKVIEWPDDHKDELRLWLRLFSCKMLIENEIRRRLWAKFDITLARFDLMAQLYEAPAAMRLGELSQRLMVSNGNITGLVNQLVEQGLIERRPASHDRRAHLVKLTNEGRRIFCTMAASHELWIGKILGELTDAECDALMRLIGKAKAAARRVVAT